MTIGNELPNDINEQDVYLISGSPLSVRDNHSFSKKLYEFIQSCDSQQKPLIGTCFGHQAIAVALGGNVKKSKIKWNGNANYIYSRHMSKINFPHCKCN